MEANSLKKWLQKVLVSFTEQGLYSFPNFLLNIFLARWLPTDEYGAFAFGFSILLFLSGFHTALILEPMIVLGPAKYNDRLFAYLRSMLRFHAVLTAAAALLGVLVSLVVRLFSTALADGLFGASIGLPFILLFWLFRRACYMFGSPQMALKGSLLYAISLSSVFLLRSLSMIGILSAFLVMAAGSLLASLWVWLDLLRTVGSRSPSVPFHEIWPEHWRYGRWASGSGVVSWLSSTVTIPILGVLLGLSQAGIFRALQNFILPLQQISAALDSLFVPWLSGQSVISPWPRFLQKSRILISGYSAIGLGYMTALLIGGEQLINVLYANPQYLAFSRLIIFFALYGLADTLSHAFSSILRSIQKPNSVFWAQLGSAVVSLISNIYLIMTLGFPGASYAMLAAGIVMLLILLYLYRKEMRGFVQRKTVQVDTLRAV